LCFWSIRHPQSAVTLYIYRVGWTYPARNLFMDLNLWKSLVVHGLYLDRSDRSVVPDRLREPQPVRPLGHTGQTGSCQIWSSTHCTMITICAEWYWSHQLRFQLASLSAVTIVFNFFQPKDCIRKLWYWFSPRMWDIGIIECVPVLMVY